MKGITPGKRKGKHLGEMVERGGKSRPPAQIAPGQRWWREDFKEEQVAPALMSTIQQIWKNQTSLIQESLILSRLYGGRLPGSSFGTPLHAIRGIHPSLSGRLTYNGIAIVIDSLISSITKENLSTQFVTTGGDYRQQRRSKKLSQFADGISYETKMDEDVGPDVLRDSLLTPCGIAQTYIDRGTKRVVTERLMGNEVFVDYVDGFYGKPRQIHKVKMVDREQVLEWTDDKKVQEAIKANHDTGILGYGGEYQGMSDDICVGESWHLPSGVDDNGEPTKDGRHVIYISNAVITPREEREWKKKRYPFSVLRWKKDTEGWHGIPLGRDLIGSQVEMNHLLIMFQRAFRMMAAFRIWLEQGTIPDAHFQDKIGTILHGPRGSRPPVFLTPTPMSEMYFLHFEKIKERMFEIARRSRASAVGDLPARLSGSGEAQRVYHDIEAEGYAYANKQYEAFRRDVCECQVDAVRDVYTEDKSRGYPMRALVQSSALPGHRFLRQLDWKQISLDEDEYILRGYSTSALPSTPAGRYATIAEWMRAGLIDVQTAQKLMNVPDLTAQQTLLGAAEDWIMSCLDDIVERGKKREVSPYMNIAMAKTLGIQEYSLGAANNMELPKLEQLDAWISGAQRLEAKAQKAAMQQQIQATMAAQAGIQAMKGNGAPMGVGAPPQTSAYLPPAGMKGAI